MGRARREPAQLEAPPGNAERPGGRIEGWRKLRALRVELDVHRLLELEPITLRLARKEILDCAEVAATQTSEVIRGRNTAIAVQRVEPDPQRFLPALRRDAIEPGVERDRKQHQQEQSEPDAFPHRRSSQLEWVVYGARARAAAVSLPTRRL